MLAEDRIRLTRGPTVHGHGHGHGVVPRYLTHYQSISGLRLRGFADAPTGSLVSGRSRLDLHRFEPQREGNGSELDNVLGVVVKGRRRMDMELIGTTFTITGQQRHRPPCLVCIRACVPPNRGAGTIRRNNAQRGTGRKRPAYDPHPICRRWRRSA